MNILYIITQADGGGAQKYVLSLAKHFRGSIAAGSEATKLFEDANRLSLSTFNLRHLKRNINPLHDLLAIWEIRDLIKKLQPDIVHLNSSKAGVLGSFACIGLKTKAMPHTGQQGWTGVRVVYTAHGFVFNEPLPFWLKSFYLALEKVASTYRSFIIAVSEADRKSALEKNLITPEKISVVYNGINQINFVSKEEARHALNQPLDKFIVGNTSNTYFVKGIDVLINAFTFPSILNIQPIKGTFIGSGPEKDNIKAQIKELEFIEKAGISKKIDILKSIANVSKYLKAFDIFVLPSRKEGFPFGLLEAMQAGLPIIATDVGGNKEAIGDAGILVEPENPKAIAEAIEKLYSNEVLRKNLSQKALERSKLFTEEKMFLETKKVYEKVLGHI